MLPEDLRRMRFVERVLRRTFELYGYEEVQTPTLEPFSLFEQKSGEEVEKHMYTFTDKGGRKVALRPELTPSVARLYASKSGELKLPVKWYYFSNAFRYDEPQRMRYREFWHAGVELIGASSVESDLEMVCLTVDAMKGLGFRDFKVVVGDVGVLRGILGKSGYDFGEQSRVLLIVDKRRKVPEREFEEMLLSALKGDEKLFEQLKGLMEFEGEDPSEVLAHVKGAERAEQSVERLSKLFGMIRGLDLERWVEFSPSLARGLAYYTGMVFEPYVEGIPYAMGGGGRYDDLVRLYGGPDVPCIGLSFGADRLKEAMVEEGLSKASKPSLVFVSYVSEETRPHALKVAGELRSAGIAADVELRSRTIAKQLEYADKRGCPLVVIVGRREVESAVLRLKDLSTGQEKDVPLDELVPEVKKRISPLRP